MFSIDVKESVLKKAKKLNKKTGRTKRADQTCNLWINADSETLGRLVWV